MNVNLEILKKDIRDTQQEYIAYDQIARGFVKLYELSGKSNPYYKIQYIRYFDHMNECGLLLNNLQDILNKTLENQRTPLTTLE